MVGQYDPVGALESGLILILISGLGPGHYKNTCGLSRSKTLVARVVTRCLWPGSLQEARGLGRYKKLMVRVVVRTLV